MHIIAHTESIDGCTGFLVSDSLTDVAHRLGSKSLYVAFLDGIVVWRVVIGADGIGNLRVADNDHLILPLLAIRQAGKRKVVYFLFSFDSLIEASRAIGIGMCGNLAIGWNRIVYKPCQTVSLHLVSASRIGFHTSVAIAHDDVGHSVSLLVGKCSADGVVCFSDHRFHLLNSVFGLWLFLCHDIGFRSRSGWGRGFSAKVQSHAYCHKYAASDG